MIMKVLTPIPGRGIDSFNTHRSQSVTVVYREFDPHPNKGRLKSLTHT